MDLQWLRYAIMKVRKPGGPLFIKAGNTILARQNPNTGSAFASLVRSGKVRSQDLIWILETKGTWKNWIAFIDFVHRKVHVLNRKRFPPIKVNKGWTLTYEKPSPSAF